VGHTSRLKVLELTFFCTAHVAYSSHRWWPFLVALDSFRQDLFNSTSGVIIRVSVWLRVFLFFFFSFFSLSLLSVLNAMFIKFAIWKSGHDICDSQIIYVTYKFLKCIISLNIFCFVLFYYYFYYTLVQKHSTLEAQYHATPFLFISVLIHIYETVNLDMEFLEQNSSGKDRQGLREERKWIGTSRNSLHYGQISKFNPMKFENFAWALVIG
jgi:hypothetical protein